MGQQINKHHQITADVLTNVCEEQSLIIKKNRENPLKIAETWIFENILRFTNEAHNLVP